MKSRSGAWIWRIALVWGVIGGVLAVMALSQRAPSGPSGQTAPEAGLRMLIVSDAQPAPASTPDGPLHAMLLHGEVGGTPTVATVLTDKNCEPDARGYSHCLNDLEMPGGAIVSVQHIHRMSEVSCLTPGERVNIRSV